MNRQMRRAQSSLSRELQRTRPWMLTEIPKSQWPSLAGMTKPPIKVWHSHEFLVQLFEEEPFNGIAVKRATVCRVTIEGNNDWTANIKWEELQHVKNNIGFGDWYAVELYPRDRDVVNVANIRHLWMLEKPLSIGWFKSPPVPLSLEGEQ